MPDYTTPTAVPTQEQMRDARRQGFADSVAHMPEDQRGQLTERHNTQDARREANVSGFYNSILGG